MLAATARWSWGWKNCRARGRQAPLSVRGSPAGMSHAFLDSDNSPTDIDFAFTGTLMTRTCSDSASSIDAASSTRHLSQQLAWCRTPNWGEHLAAQGGISQLAPLSGCGSMPAQRRKAVTSLPALLGRRLTAEAANETADMPRWRARTGARGAGLAAKAA